VAFFGGPAAFFGSYFSGLSYFDGFTVAADSFSFDNFYAFKSDKNLDMADSPSLPFIMPNATRAASLISPV